jgi:hypothetical protein
MDNRWNCMHQIRASIGSTISHGISGGMLAWLMVQSAAEGLACAGKCKVNSSDVFAGGWLQVSRGTWKIITSHGNRGVLLQSMWRRRGLFKFLAPAPSLLARPFSLQYCQQPAHPLSLPNNQTHIPIQTTPPKKRGPNTPQKCLKPSSRKPRPRRRSRPNRTKSSTTDKQPAVLTIIRVFVVRSASRPATKSSSPKRPSSSAPTPSTRSTPRVCRP